MVGGMMRGGQGLMAQNNEDEDGHDTSFNKNGRLKVIF
jgi:hypothetical protein